MRAICRSRRARISGTGSRPRSSRSDLGFGAPSREVPQTAKQVYSISTCRDCHCLALTRQSIVLRKDFLRRKMDPRVKPAGDTCGVSGEENEPEKGLMVAFANILLGGVFHAAVLFLVAAGLQLVFGVQKILNLACGSFYALGAYFGVSF